MAAPDGMYIDMLLAYTDTMVGAGGIRMNVCNCLVCHKPFLRITTTHGKGGV